MKICGLTGARTQGLSLTVRTLYHWATEPPGHITNNSPPETYPGYSILLYIVMYVGMTQCSHYAMLWVFVYRGSECEVWTKSVKVRQTLNIKIYMSLICELCMIYCLKSAGGPVFIHSWPCHSKDVIKMVPVVPLFSTGHSKGKILALSQELR